MEKYGSWIGINSIIIETPQLPHGFFGIFISDKSIIEEGVIIFHHVTIGSNTLIGSKGFGSPHIEKNVYIGAGAKIIGGIRVGANSRIGANTIIHKSIPKNSLAILSDAKIIVRDFDQKNKFISIHEIGITGKANTGDEI